jgi:hypothetical protein
MKEDYTHLSEAIAAWFVRRDGKYYEIDNYTVALALPDVQAICIERLREDMPELATKENLKAAFKRSFTQLDAPATQRVGTWDGRVICTPGTPERLVRRRGLVSINVWQTPQYRQLRVNAEDWGPVREFLAWMFPREDERIRFLDWLAWSLQNEDQKPNWAPFLYSDRKGTGKSSLAAVATALFGPANTATQNNVDKLTGRFNMSLLLSKFVVSEEVKLQAGTRASNTLKTFITEPTVMAEMKGREAVPIEQKCCFLMTSNHLPLWIEPDERRYWIAEINHDGYASGPRSKEFTEIVSRVHEMLTDPEAVARLYNALMRRELAPDFSGKTLNIAIHSTDVMRRIQNAAPLVTTERLREYLDGRGKTHIPEFELVAFFKDELKTNPETLRHKMIELGWSRRSVKWGGVDYARNLWLRPGYTAYRGEITAPDGSRFPIASAMEEEMRL